VLARGVIQSPVLVGWDAFLTLIEDRLADAAAGAGRVLFVAGEAGIGKTGLLGSIARRARAGGFAVFRAAAFPGDVQSVAGLMLDLASDLMSAPEPVLGQLGQSLASRIRVIPADAGDAHHRRRLLVQDLADLLVTVDPGAPLLIILEDLHRADELSLDVLGHLAGRIANRPILIAGAYRSDELYPSVPLRELRSRLLGQRLAEEIRLLRLSLDQTATMTSATLGRAVPAQLVTAIHERTDGIPLHVEEFLAAIDENTLTPQSGAAVQAAAVPECSRARGRAESRRIGDDEAALNAATTLGSVLVFAGRMDEGWQLLEEAIADAGQTCQEAEAARGYRMIGSSASELMEYDRAERWLTEGVRYAENAELWNHRHYMAAHLAHVQWATGQWDAAVRTAQGALADGRGGITTRITAQYVLGYLAMGRGDWTAADDLLLEALATGEHMAELQRLSPPLWGLAEAARCRGDYDTALTRCERGYQASAEVMDAASLFPTCSPACGRIWRAATSRPPRSGWPGSARC